MNSHPEMIKENSRLDFIKTMKEIRTADCSKKAKIALMQSFVRKLKEINQQQDSALTPYKPKYDLQSTSYSFYSDSPSRFDYDCWEDRIMEKRVVKFQNNEEIEGLEDDLFEMQKVVDTKREFNEQLGRKIDQNMAEISEIKEKKERKKSKSTYLNSSLHNFTGYFKQILK